MGGRKAGGQEPLPLGHGPRADAEGSGVPRGEGLRREAPWGPAAAGAGPLTHRWRRRGSGGCAAQEAPPGGQAYILSRLRIDHMKAGGRQVLSAATKECPPQNKGQEPLRRGRSRLARSQPPMLRREPRRGVHPAPTPEAPRRQRADR